MRCGLLPQGLPSVLRVFLRRRPPLCQVVVQDSRSNANTNLGPCSTDAPFCYSRQARELADLICALLSVLPMPCYLCYVQSVPCHVKFCICGVVSCLRCSIDFVSISAGAREWRRTAEVKIIRSLCDVQPMHMLQQFSS